MTAKEFDDRLKEWVAVRVAVAALALVMTGAVAVLALGVRWNNVLELVTR